MLGFFLLCGMFIFFPWGEGCMEKLIKLLQSWDMTRWHCHSPLG